jgi:hypothetical protein
MFAVSGFVFVFGIGDFSHARRQSTRWIGLSSRPSQSNRRPGKY